MGGPFVKARPWLTRAPVRGSAPFPALPDVVMTGALAPSPTMREDELLSSGRGEEAASGEEKNAFVGRSHVSIAPCSALARCTAQRDRHHRRPGAQPVDAARRYHRSPDLGEADPGGRLGVSPGA